MAKQQTATKKNTPSTAPAAKQTRQTRQTRQTKPAAPAATATATAKSEKSAPAQKRKATAEPVKAKNDKKAKKVQQPVESESEEEQQVSDKEEEEEQKQEQEQEQEETQLLSDEDDSSASEGSDDDEELDSDDQAEIKRLLMEGDDKTDSDEFKRKVYSNDNAGVVLISRLPKGFEETELRKYFQQFGKLLAVRMFRSYKTGNTRHKAMIKFADQQVAQIAAETMHNYLLFDRLLQCKYLPMEKIHPTVFAKRTQLTPLATENKHHRRSAKALNRDRTEEQTKERLQNLLKRENKRRKDLVDCGIDYDFPGYKADIEKRGIAL